MTQINKPCPINAKDVEFLLGKDCHDNVVDVPVDSLPDFPEVDVECQLQNSPTINGLKAKDNQLQTQIDNLNQRIKDIRVNKDMLKKSIEELESLNLCNVELTLCDVEGDTAFHGKVTADEMETELITAKDGNFERIKVSEKATIADEEVEHSHIVEADIDTANIEQANIENEEVNTSHINDLEAERVLINEKLEVLGDTITNGIENTGKITTDDLETKTLEVTEKATIEDEEVNHSHIVNAEIDEEEVQKSHIIYAEIDEEEVQKSHIVEADIDTANIEQANIENEEVQHSHIVKADIDDEEVQHSHIVKADIDDEEVQHSHIVEADVDTANIEQANIENEEVQKSHIVKATIDEEEVAKSHIVDLTAEDVLIKNTLEVKGQTTTNGIDNTGDIVTDNIDTKTANVSDTLTAKNAEITNAEITNEEVVKSHIINATIDKEEVLSSHIENLKADDVKIENDLRVKGKATIGEIEVEGNSMLRGNVEIKDDLKVNGDSVLNGDVVINGDTEFNGSEHHDGDVEIEGNLTVKGSFDVGSIEVTGYQKLTEKGVPGGYTPLDSTGKVPSQFLPDMGQGGMTFQGGWNAGSGRYPTGANIGDLFYVTNGGTVGGIEYHIGDRIVMQDGGTRFRMEDTGGVTSVNNRVGDVIGLEEVQNKVTAINKTAQSDTYYPSEKAVYDYINPIEETVKDLKETMDEWTSKEAVFEGDVVIEGDTVIEEGLTVKENVVIEKDLEVDGDATIKGDETVEGKVTINGGTEIEGGTKTDTLEVTGESTLDGNTTIKGTTTMEDNVTMNKDLTVQGNETVDGKVTANGGLDVTGGSKTDTLEVTGDTTLDGGLTVVGESTFNDNVQIDGDLNVDGDTTLNNVEVKGELTLDDDLLVKGTLTVNGKTTLNDDVQIDTNLNVDGIITGEVKYDNTESGLEAENVQDAIDELENNKWQKPLFAKPEGLMTFAEGNTDVTPQIKVTTPYIDKEKKTLNVWDGEEWIDIGGGSGNSDIVYLTMEEYEALSPEEKADPNKNYAIYINGEGGDTYLATADQIAFDKSGTDLESENVQDAIEELNNKMGTSSQMMTMEEYEELVDKKEGTFYFIYEE